VIVFLNGAFGVGKTSTARILQAEIPGSILFDPEWVGSMLMAALGERPDWPADYQLLPAWRRIVVSTVHELRRELDDPLIVPMTVLRAEVWRELSAGFREADAELRAFRLTATEATLRARILCRPEDEGPHDWCLGQMPAALAALQDEEYGIEIPTDERTPGEIGAAILGTL
jgi:predicted kinase